MAGVAGAAEDGFAIAALRFASCRAFAGVTGSFVGVTEEESLDFVVGWYSACTSKKA